MDSVTSIGNPVAASPAQTSVTGLADNFDTFLTLLTTQLQNQDPLSPMESNEFTQQLVQFSQVEQSIATNTNLESILGVLGANNTANTVAFIGKDITFQGGTNALVDGAARWSYVVPANAADVTLTIQDADGKLVYTAAGQSASGSHDFTWDGKDNSGDPLEDGVYTLTVSAKDAENSALDTVTFSTGRVTGVQSGETEAELLIGDAAVPLSLMLKASDGAPPGQT